MALNLRPSLLLQPLQDGRIVEGMVHPQLGSLSAACEFITHGGLRLALKCLLTTVGFESLLLYLKLAISVRGGS